MIYRKDLHHRIKEALDRSRIVVLLGPRQCGKTTLAREFIHPDSKNYFDLEDPVSLIRLEEPMTALRELEGLVVIDEIQRRAELFPVLRVLADRKPLPARFLILGSASPELLRQSSESLAGRVELITMGGFDLAEVGSDESSKLWLRGGFPDSFTAANESNSFSWRKNFIQTFLERDLPSAGISIEPAALYRFWSMLAHYHGQIWNASEPARSLGVSQPTVRRYLDLLSGFFMVRQLAPWHANLKKRQVKSPKIYFRDSGLLHQILGIRLEKDLLTSAKCGASWEGYVIEEVIQAFNPDESYFWATHNGAEIDLLMVKEGRVYGVECKRMDAPKMTPSMQIAMTDLNLKRMAVIYPGAKRFPLADGIEVVPLQDLAQGGQALFP
jgi:predicted AAA+ superfamily ATPase